MTWDYQKFTRHPVAAEKFEMRGRNTILSNYNYRVDIELGKGVFVVCRIICAYQDCVAQLEKDWLPTIPPSSQPRYAHV